jgi:ABC-type antimicrobial peptide transport system permease subunit
LGNSLVVGSVITENVFAWPGVGRLLVDSVANRDLAVVQVAILLIAASIYGQLLSPYLTEDQIVVIMPGTLSALEFREVLRANGNHSDPIIV